MACVKSIHAIDSGKHNDHFGAAAGAIAPATAKTFALRREDYCRHSGVRWIAEQGPDNRPIADAVSNGMSELHSRRSASIYYATGIRSIGMRDYVAIGLALWLRICVPFARSGSRPYCQRISASHARRFLGVNFMVTTNGRQSRGSYFNSLSSAKYRSNVRVKRDINMQAGYCDNEKLTQKRGASAPLFINLNLSAVAAACATAAKKPFPKTFCLAFDLLSFLKRFHVVSPLNVACSTKWLI